MKTVHARRLLKLAKFLREMPREKFDFGVITLVEGLPMMEALAAGKHRCGTVGCAIGWMPAVWPKLLRWSAVGSVMFIAEGAHSYSFNFEVAEQFFGLSTSEAHYLFDPRGGYGEYRNSLYSDATSKQVAAHIERFVKRGGKPARH